MALPLLQSKKDGPSVGVKIDTRIYVWNERVDAVSLSLKKTSAVAYFLVNAAAYVFTLGSLFYFVYLLVVPGFAEQVLTLSFWHSPSRLGLFLSFFVFGACFIFYRFVQLSKK